MNRAILAPTNETMDDINSTAISIFLREGHVYNSFDRVEVGANNSYQSKFLNSLAPVGLPPHKLELKVGE